MRRDPFILEELSSPFSSIGLFRLFKDEPFFFFLDSGMGAQKLGRYSFMGFDPFLIFRSKEDRIQVIEEGIAKELKDQNPFHILKGLLNRYKLREDSGLPPFIGGAVGYFSYDLCRHIEKVPSRSVDDLRIWDSYVPFYDTVIILDHLKDKTYIASSARKRADGLKRRIDNARVIANPGLWDPLKKGGRLSSNFKKSGYLAAIERAKDYIGRGDIYQVNLSQRFSCELNLSAAELFERLKAINPAPFSSYLDFGDIKVISASPERFLCKRGRNIHTRPIKGTRPRSIDPLEDERLKTELCNCAKDRAEHVMIVDLERNDLGRICEYGSVLATEFIILEAYSTVFHLVSTVSGILRPDTDAVDCLLNCFPGGSITGAPKIRSMEIIDELEPTKRSIYTGAIGYIGFNGNMDTSIAIRTFIIKDNTAHFQVGGGIVADSEPEMEYQETLDKAKALIDSLQGKPPHLNPLPLKRGRGNGSFFPLPAKRGEGCEASPKGIRVRGQG